MESWLEDCREILGRSPLSSERTPTSHLASLSNPITRKESCADEARRYTSGPHIDAEGRE